MLKYQMITDAQALFRALAMASGFVIFGNFVVLSDAAAGMSAVLFIAVAAILAFTCLVKLPGLFRLTPQKVSELQTMMADCPEESRVIVQGLMRGCQLRERDYRFVRKAFISHLEKRNSTGSVLQQ
jgi:hypothetical protein